MKESFFLFAIALIVALPLTSNADTPQEKFWADYIEACNPASSLNKHAHFLGTTNTIGPGSVWGTANGTTNFIAPASAYLGKEDASGKLPLVVYATSNASCSGAGSRNFNLTLGVPISFAATSSSADIGATLRNAKSITVEIKAVQVDAVPVALWSDAAARNVSHSSSVYTMAVDGSHYVMIAAVAIAGLKIEYKLDSSSAVTVKAQITASNVVNIGTAANPINASVNVGTDGQTVTVTATDRAYVLGQFAKINKIKQSSKDPQDASFIPVLSSSESLKLPKPSSVPTVKATTVDKLEP